MATDRSRPEPRDARPDPKPMKHLWLGIALVVVLALALWALQHFGRHSTSVTPGGTKVPESASPAEAPTGKAPPSVRQ